jgi:hypothetical protein
VQQAQDTLHQLLLLLLRLQQQHMAHPSLPVFQ